MSATFDTKAEAEAWAIATEARILAGNRVENIVQDQLAPKTATACVSAGITALTPATLQFNKCSTERTDLWLSYREACGLREPTARRKCVTVQGDAMRQVRADLGRRLMEHARNSTTDLSEGVMFNDVSVYTDPKRFEAEMTKLYRGMPVVACLSSDLPSPGSFRLFDDVGVPIVLVRGMDNEVRAFLNICRHRGARLVRENQGCKKRFSCRFHGWTYDTKGHAGNVAQEEHFCGAIDEYKKLIPCPAAERHGLVFVQATPNSTMDIDAHLGSFGPELAKLGLPAHKRVCEQDLHATCNWKYAYDTYFENYHFSFLHRQSLGPVFINDIMLYDAWGPHHRVVYPPRHVEQWEDSDTLAASYFIFPNTVIYCGALSPDKLFINLMRMFPVDVGNIITHVETYGPQALADDPAYKAGAEESLEGIIRLVQDEDYDVTSESWKNFLSMPEDSKVVYGRQELALQHSHQWFAKAAGYAPPAVAVPELEGIATSNAA